MVVHVQFPDGKYDYVDTRELDELISKGRIERFYRPSEQRWVVIGEDRTRGKGGRYSGSERRRAKAKKISDDEEG